MTKPTREQRVNTEVRVPIKVRPVVSSFAEAMEDSFADHDNEERFIGSWTGKEKPMSFVHVATLKTKDALTHLGEAPWQSADKEMVRRKIVEAGAYLAMALMCVDEE